MKIFKDKKFLRECAIILIVGIIINTACFLMPLVVHAENSIQRLPYDYSWNYYPISQENIDMMLNHASPYVDITSENLIIFWNEIGDSSWLYNYCVAVVDSVTFSEGYNYDTTDLTQQSVYFHFSESYIGQTQLTSNGLWLDANQSYAPAGYTFFGTYATIVHPTDYPYDYTFRNMPLYGHVILDGKTYIGSNNIDVGDFTDLPGIDEILNNIQNTWEPPSTITGHALPSAPTENPNNTPFQDRLQMFEYLKDSINAIVGNLGYNIKNWLDNLIGKMVEGFNSVSQNIWNGFKTLMDNIKDFFGPKIDGILDVLAEIRDKTGYLTDDFDYEEIVDYYEENCSLFELTSSVSSFHSSLSSAFSDIVPPQRLVFNIDFSNGPWPFSTVGIVSFNFDWYENIRNTIVPWILTFLYFGAVFSLGMQLPNIVHGMSGLFSPTLTGTQSISYMDTDGAYSSYNKVNTDHYSMFGGSMHFTKQHAYSSVSYKNKYGLPSVRK